MLWELGDMNVKKIYQDLLARGYTKKDAAKEAQARTGLSVVTGRSIRRQFSETSKSYKYGQYIIPKRGQYG